MRRSIATVSLSGTLHQKLEAIAAARFDGIELFEPDFISFTGSARELRQQAADLGLGIDLYQPFRDFEGMPDDLFRRSLDRAERKFDVMQELGCPLMLVCSNTSPASLGDAERAAAQLHELAERASRRNLRIGYEALAWGKWVNLYQQAWNIVEKADHPHLGLILDSFHTLSLRDDPMGIADIPGDRIFFVQMADAPLLAMDVLQWARHHRNFPGQGQLDVVTFFEQALLAGYQGNLSLEIFNDVFRETPNRRTALDAMRSLLFLESECKNRLMARTQATSSEARAPAATRALQRLDLAAPPAVQPVGGFSFIEFGVDEPTGHALASTFTALGFEHTGRHRSKAVDLYCQGDIQFVINTQPGSEARQRFDELGPSVCAMGLVAPDPVQAANRAVALLSARHVSPLGPNELQLPAIISPGGAVVHFVHGGSTLDADFVAPVPRAPVPAQCGLTHVDHMALALANDQLDTWTLFAQSILGLNAGESLELADPFGLIRSCALTNAERSLRLVLNVSKSQRTRTAQQVRATGRSGGGVHHIALATNDIFATVQRLAAQGVKWVPISPNYYDDLLARLDLDEALVRRMQALNIVADVSPGGGRFLHAYTEPFADRFFFEVVQREGGYDGYGAVNAAVRMAAQEQAQYADAGR
ncbi:bifunctional sugar phosphate isomerase/epimerase/4-hydroxyphenylpyruvate dioxygenase family protein [Acidovorax sp. 106]|uniref:bifunctional sugar phosphate isomerase/epimerase/4-hydroxyphenylpyruvate dioxygenase family protein n=1 Tax=Acidovorax sp. 106 TaxID=2135637 RepID=UPI000EB4B266|nr:sugar phosphate isomerase/epimerase and 4-hydroxyphenylpyruvate domain-containing protein [Acidovorax sp. 106]RLJ36488.1 4-hydroxyphenylpyruvate dioxygenase [Acidovorax sp. 106]